MGLLAHFSVGCGPDRIETRINNLVNIFSLEQCLSISPSIPSVSSGNETLYAQVPADTYLT